MTTTQLRFTGGSYISLLLATALPVALQTLLMSAKSFIDVLLLGLTDADSVTAAGLAGRLVLVVVVLLGSLTAGGGYVSAQCANTPDKLAATTTLTLGVTVLVSLVTIAAVTGGAYSLLGLSTYDKTLLDLASRYLSIMSLTFPLMAVGAVMSSFLRIQRHARTVFIISTVGLLVNVLATLAFILPLGGGIAGAAWGTLLGAVVEVGLLSWRILPVWHHFWSLQHITLRQLTIIVSQSLFTGLGSLSWALGAFMFYTLLGRTGTDTLYALAILTPLESLLLSFALGLSTASGIELGKRIPSESRVNIHTMAHCSLALSLGVTLALVALIVLARQKLPALFTMGTPPRQF